MSKHSILIASDSAAIREMARDAAREEGLEAVVCGDGEEALESAKSHAFGPAPLKLLVLEAFLPKMDGFEVVNKLQDSPQTRNLPVLMLIGQGANQPAQFQSGGRQPQGLPSRIRLRGDNYLKKPFQAEEVRSEIHSMTKHFRAHGAEHPVTALPGHIQIENEVMNRLAKGEACAMLWMDINHFRPFNDHYGTGRGDEVLKAVAALMQKTLVTSGLAGSAFLGQVAGDDFVILMPENKVDSLKQTLRDAFQAEIQRFYTEEERAKGFFYEKGRDQKDQIFPLMNLSMAVAKIALEQFVHYGQAVAECGELLRQTKVGAQDVK